MGGRWPPYTTGPLNASVLDHALGVGILDYQVSYEAPKSIPISFDGQWHATWLDRGVVLLFEGRYLRHAYGRWLTPYYGSSAAGLAFPPDNNCLTIVSQPKKGCNVHDITICNIPGGEIVIRERFKHAHHVDLKFRDHNGVPDFEVDISPELETVWSPDSKQVAFPLRTSYRDGGCGPFNYARYTCSIPGKALCLLEIGLFGEIRTKRGIAFSPDGSWIVSMYPSRDKSGLRVSNARNGDLVRTVNYFSLNGVAFSASADEEAHFFLDYGMLACKLPSSRLRLTSARRRPREGRVASLGSGSGVNTTAGLGGAVGPYPWYYDAPSRELAWYMAEADSSITTADFWIANKDDRLVLVGIGRSDGRVEVFNGRTGASVVASRADDDLAISRVLFVPDGKAIWYVRGDEKIIPVNVPHT